MKKVEVVRDFTGDRWVAKIDGEGPLLVPTEDDEVETIGDLLRWVGNMDDAIRDDESDHTGIADMLATHRRGRDG